MSSVPPPGSGYPPPPPPPPQGPPPVMPSGPGLAWETQPIGPESFFDTAKMFITAPDQAWARTRETGDYMRPLIFALIVGWVGAIFNAVWGSMFGAGMHEDDPAAVRRPLGPLAGGGGGLIVNIILAPLFIACGLFIGSAIFHVSFMIVGALKGSRSQFEGTFRVVSYSSIAHIAYVIPVRRRARRARVADLPHDARRPAAPQDDPGQGPHGHPAARRSSAASAPRSGSIFAGAALFSAFNR